MKKVLLLTTLMLALTLPVLAADNNDRPRRQGPPPESLDACADLQAGDSCSFTCPVRGMEIEGVCVTSRRSDDLHCRPNDPPGGGRGKGRGKGRGNNRN